MQYVCELIKWAYIYIIQWLNYNTRMEANLNLKYPFWTWWGQREDMWNKPHQMLHRCKRPDSIPSLVHTASPNTAPTHYTARTWSCRHGGSRSFLHWCFHDCRGFDQRSCKDHQVLLLQLKKGQGHVKVRSIMSAGVSIITVVSTIRWWCQ